MSTAATPAEPVNPVSHSSRSSEGGTYSFWWRSARGNTKPVSPRRASSVRNAATRGPLAPPSAGSSNDWKRASNMLGNLLAAQAGGNTCSLTLRLHPSRRVWRPSEHQRHPIVERDAPLKRESLRSEERRVGK